MNQLRLILPAPLKRLLWNLDFLRGEYTTKPSAEDFIYPHIAKYLQNGSLLDMGCATGQTARETTFSHYTGVDISPVAIAKAKPLCPPQCEFVVSDFESFQPSRRYDVILFRESIYYIKPEKLNDQLDRLAKHLDGVFMARIYNPSEHAATVALLRHRPGFIAAIPSPGKAVLFVFR